MARNKMATDGQVDTNDFNLPGDGVHTKRTGKVAIPPQFMKKGQAKPNPVADAKKKVAAQRLAKMKAGVKDTDKDGK